MQTEASINMQKLWSESLHFLSHVLIEVREASSSRKSSRSQKMSMKTVLKGKYKKRDMIEQTWAADIS